jgi:hypothetical protein
MAGKTGKGRRISAIPAKKQMIEKMIVVLQFISEELPLTFGEKLSFNLNGRPELK